MFISVAEHNGRYSFIAGENTKDDPKALFWSFRDFYLVDGLPSTYSTFGEAHAYAQRLVDSRPSAIMAKRAGFYRMAKESEEFIMNPEDTMVSHYNEQLNIIQARLNTALEDEDLDAEERSDELGVISQEIEGVKKELASLEEVIEDEENMKTVRGLLALADEMAGKIPKTEALQAPVPPVPPVAPQLGATAADCGGFRPPKGHLDTQMFPECEGTPADRNIVRKTVEKRKKRRKTACSDHKASMVSAVLRAYGEKAVCALQPLHPKAYVQRAAFVPDNGTYEVWIGDGSGEDDLAILVVDESLFLTDVVLAGGRHVDCPRHNEDFLRKYLEPVAVAVGHLKLPGSDVVLVADGAGDSLRGFNISDKSGISMSLAVENDGTWWFKPSALAKTAASKFTEEEMKPGLDVVCIAKELPGYYGRTGKVVSVVPMRDYLDVTVDFGRGLGTMVLTDASLEKYDLGG